MQREQSTSSQSKAGVGAAPSPSASEVGVSVTPLRGGDRNWRTKAEQRNHERQLLVGQYETRFPSLDLFVPYSAAQWRSGRKSDAEVEAAKQRDRARHGHFLRFNSGNRSVHFNRFSFTDVVSTGGPGGAEKRVTKRIINASLLLRSSLRMTHGEFASLLFALNGRQIEPVASLGGFYERLERNIAEVSTPYTIHGRLYTLHARWLRNSIPAGERPAGEAPFIFELSGSIHNETLTVVHQWTPSTAHPSAVDAEYFRTAPPTVRAASLANDAADGLRPLSEDAAMLAVLPPHFRDPIVADGLATFSMESWPTPAVEIRDAGQLVALREFLESSVMHVFVDKPAARRGVTSATATTNPSSRDQQQH